MGQGRKLFVYLLDIFLCQPFDLVERCACLSGGGDVFPDASVFFFGEEQVEEAAGDEVNCVFEMGFFDEFNHLGDVVVFQGELTKGIVPAVLCFAGDKTVVSQSSEMPTVSS